MKLIRVAFIVSIVGSLLAASFIKGAGVDERAFLKGLAGDEVVFKEKLRNPPHYPSNTDVIAFNSYDILPSVRGYAGPIRTLIAIDSKGIIRGVRIIQHRETENYVHYMLTPAYLNQYVGKRVTDPLRVDVDIDGISRATVSVRALAKTVRLSSRAMAERLFGIKALSEPNGGSLDLKAIVYILFFGLSLVAYHYTRKRKTLLRYRRWFLFTDLLIVGIYGSAFFSILHVMNALTGNYSTSLFWMAVVGGTLLSVVLAGRLYCGWLCPFGALLELMDRIGGKGWLISERQEKRLRLIKYWLVIPLFPLVIITGRSDYANFEPYVTLFSLHGTPLMWSVLVLMVVLNLRVKRFWCRYLCPVAALLGMLSKRTEGYPSAPSCPMGNPPSPHISECIRCNICYGSRTSESE
ncbi:MAG: 4Fe-4S binding protein [Nitrospirae bacterium]|nr:MAG: 4Fe-4S binding protein [Nitrospirota bacterium]